MLATWLGTLALETFRAGHLGSAPLACPATAAGARTLLDWDVLARVLACRAPAPDVLVVARGTLLDVPPPRTRAAVDALLADGVGLCVRRAERCDPGLARLAAAFERDLGAAQVQLFVTPGGTHGFGWHYDDEDVFVAQTLGTKEYHFRPNTVAADRPAAPAAFARFADERSLPYTATLVAGDFLYVPARWWHMAVCRTTALSISVGVVPRRARAGGADAPTPAPSPSHRAPGSSAASRGRR